MLLSHVRNAIVLLFTIMLLVSHTFHSIRPVPLWLVMNIVCEPIETNLMVPILASPQWSYLCCNPRESWGLHVSPMRTADVDLSLPTCTSSSLRELRSLQGTGWRRRPVSASCPRLPPSAPLLLGALASRSPLPPSRSAQHTTTSRCRHVSPTQSSARCLQRCKMYFLATAYDYNIYSNTINYVIIIIIIVGGSFRPLSQVS